MAPNKAKANGEDTKLSQREIEIVAVAWCSVKSIKDGKPILDMNQFVDKGLYKTVDSARHCWRPIENKLLKIAAAVKAHSDNESGAPAAPGGNSTIAAAAAAPAPRTPVKAMKGALGKRKLKVYSDAEDKDAAAAAAKEEGGVGVGVGGGGVRKSRRTALPKPKMAPKKTTGAIAHAAAAKAKGAGAGAGKKRLVPTKLEETEGGYDEFESFSEVGDGEA